MPKLVFRFQRAHGYAYLVPTDDPHRAVARGVDPRDPAAQRPWDDINGVQVPRTPKPESIIGFEPAWQHLLVYQSEDLRIEMTIKATPQEANDPPSQIEIDVPI